MSVGYTRMIQGLIRLKAYVRSSPCLYSIVKKVRHPWCSCIGWLYGSYLTLRYVDKYTSFPAIIFENSVIPLKIFKGLASELILEGRLVITPFASGAGLSSIHIGQEARVIIENDFVIGDDVRIVLSDHAILRCGGKKLSSGSGITCQSKVLVRNFVSIGTDTIISWGTFITDSDHHPINGVIRTEDVIIGEHVWIASGAQILKGSCIGKDSIVAAQALVLKGDYSDNSMIAGVPAKIKGIAPQWSRD